MLRSFRLAVGFAALVLVSCGSDGSTAIHELPAAEVDTTGAAFFDTPWPTDLRLDATGHIDVSSFPNPASVRLLETYKAMMNARLTGYSVSAPAYFRFTSPIDPASLPVNGAASLEDGSSIVAVALEGPNAGERHPMVGHFREEPTLYWSENTLAVRPPHGLPFEPDTTYAIALTSELQAAGGGSVQRSNTLDQLLSGSGDADAAALYAPAVAALEGVGVAERDIVNLTVFTTQHPTIELEQARDWLVAQDPPARVNMSDRWIEDTEDYRLVHGAYVSPIFQDGELPYSTEGGEVTVVDGVPTVHGEFEARYAMTVPTTDMPESGWPIVLYAHGTGGDFQTFVRNGVGGDLARQGFVTMGVDQIHHGTRNPGPAGPESLVFNFGNPLAFRDNARQAALDVVAQAAFVRANPEITPRAIGEGNLIDPDRVYFYGHSQGGLNGPLFLAIDDQAKGGVLSGAGGHLAIALVDKVEPVNIPQLAALLLRIPGSGDAALENEHLVYEHPILAFLQTWTDVADPTNYVHYLFRDPREGFAPKSILQTEGITDAYTPPRSIEALATAAGIPPLMPVLQPIEPMEAIGLAPVSAPVSGNVAGGAATAGLIQVDGGHFVAFDDDLRVRIADFFGSFAEGVPTIP
ncbi:MAG: hypothetical protein JJ863_06420 [Deltaproteobacteria bacterium]|nr:hypothetical protein [Deltaproteobacteria bacterium]